MNGHTSTTQESENKRLASRNHRRLSYNDDQIDRVKVIAAIVVTLLCWASGFVGVRIALTGYHPNHVAAVRFVVASIVLAAVVRPLRDTLPTGRNIPAILLFGAFGIAACNVCMNAGQRTLAAGTTSFLVNTGPIMMWLMAWSTKQERLTRQQWIGISIGFCGASLVVLGQGSGLTLSHGAMLVLGATAMQSAYFVFQKPLLQRYGGLRLTTYVIWAGTLLLLPALTGVLDAFFLAPYQATLALAYLGVFSSAIAYATWAYAVERIPVTRASAWLLLLPLLTVLLEWASLGESPHRMSVVGGCIALVGVAIASLRTAGSQGSNGATCWRNGPTKPSGCG